MEPWRQLRSVLDESWFIDCDLDDAMQRVYGRQVAIGLRPEVSRERIRSNDRPNAELIAQTSAHADLVVPSLPLRDHAAE